MPLEIPVGFANVRFVFTCEGVQDEMGFSIGMKGPTLDTAQTIAEKSTDFFNAALWEAGAAVGNTYAWVRTEASLMTGTGAIVGVEPVGSQGTLGQEVPAPNLALLVTKITAQGGKKGKGRFYMPACWFFESETSAAGTVSGAVAFAMTQRWLGFLAAAELENYEAYLFHSTPGEAPTKIEGFATSTLCATQRRRMR